MYEYIISCPLSACFRASGYPQRPSLAKSLGIIVHAGQAALAAEAQHWPESGLEAEFRRQSARIFDVLANREKGKLESSDRRVEVNWDTTRVRDTRSAFIIASTSFLDAARYRSDKELATRERTIVSSDGIVIGTPDLVVWTSDEATIVDLKTGSLADHESEQRYIRQLHIYAYIWHSLHGTWPKKGILRNPVTKKEHRIPIEPEYALQIVVSARAALEEINGESDPHRLARPGVVCRRCDYRPWCEAYWRHKESERDVIGLVVDIAVKLDTRTSLSDGWLTIRTSEGDEVLAVRRGPRIVMDIKPGDNIRVIDPYLPPDSSIRVVSVFSEVFVFGQLGTEPTSELHGN